MPFEAKFSNKSKKFVKALELEDKERIQSKVQELTTNPFPSGIKSIGAYEGRKIFRVRVGEYRLLYYVNTETSLIVFVRIDKRGRVYK